MDEGKKLTQEINVLKNMKHKNVMFFYDSWIDEKNGTVNFITELFTSGTLRECVPTRSCVPVSSAHPKQFNISYMRKCTF
jgi:serine/threonine protein kinase